MDSSRQEQRPGLRLATARLDTSRFATARLAPTRFEPPALTDRTQRNDEYSRQMAAAMEDARQAGLRAAQQQVDAVVAAHDAARRQLEAATQALVEALDQLARRDEQTLGDLERQAVLFSIGLSEELIGRELSTLDDAVAAAIERAMRLVPDRGTVALRVHPDVVNAARDSLAADASLQARAELVPDPDIEAGGCVAVVGPLRIDAQIGPALARVRAALDAAG